MAWATPGCSTVARRASTVPGSIANPAGVRTAGVLGNQLEAGLVGAQQSGCLCFDSLGRRGHRVGRRGIAALAYGGDDDGGQGRRFGAVILRARGRGQSALPSRWTCWTAQSRW